MSQAAKGVCLKVQEKSKDKRWTDSHIIARQGAGVFLGGHSGYTSEDMKRMLKGGKKRG